MTIPMQRPVLFNETEAGLKRKLTVLPSACTTVLSEQLSAALLGAGCWLLAWLLLSGDELGVVALLQHIRAATFSSVCMSEYLW